MKELLDANYGNFMIFVAGGFREGDNSHAQTYYTTPFGLSERVLHRYGTIKREMRHSATPCVLLIFAFSFDFEAALSV